MDFAKIRPRGGTKAQWEKSNPVLTKREIGVQWETAIGVGEVVIKFGDGVTNWINLPEAVKSDITKKIIAALAVVPDDDPDLVGGDSLDTLFGKIAKKFKYLKDNKLDKSARYDGTDSTSTELVPTANALRGVNAKADKNASDITTLNNNLSNAGITTVKKITDLYAIKKSGFYCYDAGATNAPMSSRGGMIVANYLSDSWISLTVVPYALSKIYTNTKYNNTWVGWAESATKNDLTTVSELLSQPPSEYCTFSQWAAIAERSGNEVTLSFNVGGKIKEISTIFLLKTLPEKYRPKSNKHISYRTQEGYDMAIFIMTDGQIQLFTGGKAVSGYFLRQVITYPAA